MRVGDLVKMDFEDNKSWTEGDVWGIGIVVTVEDRDLGGDNAEVLWSDMALSWEMRAMLDVINAGR